MPNAAVTMLVAKRDEAVKTQLQCIANAEIALEKAKTSEVQFIESMNVAIRAICDHSDGRHEFDNLYWDYHNTAERGAIYMVCNTCGDKKEK